MLDTNGIELKEGDNVIFTISIDLPDAFGISRTYNNVMGGKIILIDNELYISYVSGMYKVKVDDYASANITSITILGDNQ